MKNSIIAALYERIQEMFHLEMISYAGDNESFVITVNNKDYRVRVTEELE